MRHHVSRGRLIGSTWLGIAAAILLVGVPAFAQEDKGQIDVVIVKSEEHRVPDGLTMRVRLTAITPREATEIRWRHGGEGQGGEVVRGVFPKPGAAEGADQTLEVGQWSAPVPVASLVQGRFPGKLFLTVTAGRPGRTLDRFTRRRTDYSTDAVFEFEFLYEGKVVKRFSEEGPDGGTATLVIPAYRLAGDTTPDDPEFTEELTGVLGYATERAEYLEALPWADGPLPRKYMIVNNAGGYGQGYGYGIRTTNRAVTWAELRSLRQLGVNALRDPPDFLLDMLREDDPQARPFNRGLLTHVMGFPVPQHREGRTPEPEAGCPFGEGVAERTETGVKESLESALDLRVGEVWGLTVDEIGTVIDRSPEGKGHLAVCPRCAAGFQQWLRQKGLKPSDFGQSDWSEVRPLNVWDAQSDRPWLADEHAALAAYWTRAFNNHVTAKLFTPLREAFAAANEARSRAMAGGKEPGDAARQPSIQSFALRGNTFLMKGHSLDFFDFYREADNAIVYETSNRGPRIWSWDSYLCDVQRVVGQKMRLGQGIYIKPHRGAPVQRMLSAASRGDTMLYWYTYGPDYNKGDSFSQSRDLLVLVSKAAHLLGKAEDALYGSRWTVPAEIAVVKPETTQRWMNLSGDPPHLTAAWENAKWVYTALQHAHLPVDPIDEAILAGEDLSQYKAIYVSGSHVTRAAAAALVRYVEQGGTLYTSGLGLARDEANRPLEIMEPVIGLGGRRDPEMWYEVQLYGAASLEPYDDPSRRLAAVPDGARITGGGLLEGSFVPQIGREVLNPTSEAEVLARFADGSAAVVRHRFGRGQAYVAGFFPGLEYSATVRAPDYDMRRDFQAVRRQFVAAPALALTSPVVDASDPLVEGVLLQNPANGLRSVTLANWAYGVTAMQEDSRGRRTPLVEHLPVENLKVTIRAGGEVASVTSCMLDRKLDWTASDKTITVALPRLEEGDVLLLQ